MTRAAGTSSKRSQAEASPVIVDLERWGGRYACNSSHLNFRVYDRGEPMEPVLCGGILGHWLIHLDDDTTGGEFVNEEEARELGLGRRTSVGDTRIRRDDRVVRDSSGHVLPVTTAPVEDYFHRAEGVAVKIPGVGLRLRDDLWTRAWEPGGLREPGHGPATDDYDDDDGYQPARPTRRRRPAPSVATSSPQTRQRQHMGQASGSRGRMGRT